ncbi:hypothetical protein [Aliiglaciecola lipolytica]|uniref:Uncharacterized protein n=1 Tax=Aliiglaciecola lipolytica E3 TaxID=1127673 RepID=K6XS68_9ALTE|nr:hypothetical protein [Aliiglaciecola lipolytica]GAC14526.1 hypothetical protein GLIP_1898 [Aliiglaciecola lipolytica E3]
MSKKFPMFLVFTILVSFSLQASDNQFWEVAAKFEQKWLESEKTAFDIIKSLESQIKLSKPTPLMVSQLFESKSNLYEFYGSNQDFKTYLEQNISQITKSHNYYNIYLSKLAISYFQSGELDKYHKAIHQLLLNNGSMYAAVVELTTTPSESNYQLVKSYCEDCSFYLYHKAIAQYYSELGLYSLLEELIQNLLATTYKVNRGESDIRSRLFLAYGHIALKCQNKNSEVLSELYTASISDIKGVKGFYNRVKLVLDNGCK